MDLDETCADKPLPIDFDVYTCCRSQCLDVQRWYHRMGQSSYIVMPFSSNNCPRDKEEVTLSVKSVCGQSSSAALRSCVSATFSVIGLP